MLEDDSIHLAGDVVVLCQVGVICAINGSLLPSTLWIQPAFTRISYIGIKPKLSDSSHQSCHLGTTVESCFVPPSLPYALVPDGAKWSSAPFAPLVAIVIITIKKKWYAHAAVGWGCVAGLKKIVVSAWRRSTNL